MLNSIEPNLEHKSHEELVNPKTQNGFNAAGEAGRGN